MNKRQYDDFQELEGEAGAATPMGPVRQRRGVRSGAKPGSTARRKMKLTTRRRGTVKGGIHQRANKRSTW